MKKPLFFLAVIIATFCTFSCDTKSVPAEEVETSTTLSDTISLERFLNWRGAWEDQGQAYTDSVLTRYFTMPLIDLTEFANADNFAARFHLGLDTTIVPSEPHLMLTGVDSLGADLINPAAGYYIYDVTRPCPAYCGKASIN